jgi:hypothetical protein
MEEYEIEFIFTPPGFGKKNQLCTANTIPKWYRYSKTKIKQEFQNIISEWYLPEWDDNPYKCAELDFTILRKDGKNIDSDSFAISAYKWIRDMLVINDYLVDDDRVKQTMHPTILNVDGNVETSIKTKIKLTERYVMTIEELKVKAEELLNDLEKVGGSNHVKASSARVRKILGEIKNATPQLRRDLIELDKK